MKDTAPILVLGAGNLPLNDDTAQANVLETLAAGKWGEEIEFLDASKCDPALVDTLADRWGVVVLDSIGLGAEPGTVHIFTGDEVGHLREKGARESKGLALLETARLAGQEVPNLVVIGVEPPHRCKIFGRSREIQQGSRMALKEATRVLHKMADVHEMLYA